MNSMYHYNLTPSFLHIQTSCFIKHSGVFFGAFLGPIFIVMIFNLFVFFWVIHILVKHTRERKQRSQDNLNYKDILRRLLSICGVMFLFGLTWVFAALTFNIADNQVPRITFQSLFVITASFQGFFIFIFFCLLKKEAREAWREFLSCGKDKKKLNSYYFSSLKSSKSTPRSSLKSNLRKSSTDLAENDFDSVPMQTPISKAENDLTTKGDDLSQEEINVEIPNPMSKSVEGLKPESNPNGGNKEQVTETKVDDGDDGE